MGAAVNALPAAHFAPRRRAPSLVEEMTMTPVAPDLRAKRQSARQSAFAIRLHEGRGAMTPPVVLGLPATMRPDAVPLVAIHGISRGAREIVEAFAARAADEGRPVIAPVFSEQDWSGYQRLVSPRRADLALLNLLDNLRLAGIVGAGRVDLFGYSGGAQCAHRFAMLHPQRVRRLSVCAAGWWTYPDSAAFPYGLGGAADGWGARMAAALPEFLNLDIAVSVGADDDKPDPAMRSAAALDAQQGASRLARARGWVAALHAAAAARGLAAPRTSFTVLPGSGHDFVACARAGLVDLTFGASAWTPDTSSIL